jgi:predicted neuraminidase
MNAHLILVSLAALLGFWSPPLLSRDGTSARLADSGLQRVVPLEEPGSSYKLEERGFQGIPGVARAPRGRLWATWYGGGGDEGPENYVMLATSSDDGHTWSEIKRVIDPPGLLRAFDPVLWVDPHGRLWWFYMQSYGFWDGRAGVWAATTEEPDAASPRWSVPRRLMDGIMMNKPTVRRNGDWLFPVSIWAQEPARDLPKADRKHVPSEKIKWNPDSVGAHVYRSRDRGRTFMKLATVRTANPSPDEHMIVERRDSSLWMLLRVRSGIAESTSSDGGATWAPPRPAVIPHAVARFFIRRLQSGKLLLVKHNSPNVDPAWMQGRPIVPPRQARSHLAAFLSGDDGKTWTGGLMLDERTGVSYPDGDQAADGRIFIIYDRNRKAEREILLATFTEYDVAAGAVVDGRSALRLLVNTAGRTN